MARRVTVIGGGPAGLFAARLLALDHPDWEITLFERLPPVDTFGFGVGLTGALMTSLRHADPETYEAIDEAAFPFAGAAFRLPAGTVDLSQFHAGAIGRARLLQCLLDRAVAAGVKVEIGPTATLDEHRASSDLVIAADGVSSACREELADELGVTDHLGRGLFIWCGSEMSLDGTVFFPVQSDDGLFVAHAYPYGRDASTFVIESDDESVAAAGCRQDDFPDDSASDDAALDYLSGAFSELLRGGRFVGNKSRWMRFRTISCERWHHENVVFLGDAKATAHPTLGSGTKLALEDAIALATALRDIGDDAPADHLAAFEQARRPGVARIQDRAQRSQLWWESFGSRMHLTPARLAVAYLSRAGAVSLEDLLASAPWLATQALSEWAEVPAEEVPDRDLAAWVLDRPCDGPGPWNGGRVIDASTAGPQAVVTVEDGDPWGPASERLVARVRDLAAGGAPLVSLDGDRSRSGLLDRLAVAERIRNEVGVKVAVVSRPEQLPDVADAIVAGRADLAMVNTAS